MIFIKSKGGISGKSNKSAIERKNRKIRCITCRKIERLYAENCPKNGVSFCRIYQEKKIFFKNFIFFGAKKKKIERWLAENISSPYKIVCQKSRFFRIKNSQKSRFSLKSRKPLFFQKCSKTTILAIFAISAKFAKTRFFAKPRFRRIFAENRGKSGVCKNPSLSRIFAFFSKTAKMLKNWILSNFSAF